MSDTGFEIQIYTDMPDLADGAELFAVNFIRTPAFPDKTPNPRPGDIPDMHPHAVLCAAFFEGGWSWMHLSAKNKQCLGDLLEKMRSDGAYEPGQWVWAVWRPMEWLDE